MGSLPRFKDLLGPREVGMRGEWPPKAIAPCTIQRSMECFCFFFLLLTVVYTDYTASGRLVKFAWLPIIKVVTTLYKFMQAFDLHRGVSPK